MFHGANQWTNISRDIPLPSEDKKYLKVPFKKQNIQQEQNRPCWNGPDLKSTFSSPKTTCHYCVSKGLRGFFWNNLLKRQIYFQSSFRSSFMTLTSD